MTAHRSRFLLMICASVILAGYGYYLIQLAGAETHWGLHAAADFISLEDYLPISAGKIDQMLAFTQEGHLMGIPAWMVATNFLFPLLLAGATWRYLRRTSGKVLLIALYLVPILWGPFVLRVEWVWLTRYYSRMIGGLPDTYRSYVIQPWIIRSVIPKTVLILTSLVVFSALRRGKAHDPQA